MQGAWKVGLLVVVFVGLFVVAYEILGKSLLTAKANTFYAEFADDGGAVVGTPVLMSGVKIGEVTEVNLPTPAKARLTLSILEKFSIPTGSTAQVQGSLIGLGTQPILIVPPKVISGNMPPQSLIEGKHLSALDTFLPNATETVTELNKTLVASRKLLEDEKLKGGVVKLLDTSSKTLEQFTVLAQHADAMLGRNEGTIQRAIANAAQAMSDIQKSTAIVAQFAKDPRWRTQTVALLDNLNKTSTKAQRLVDNLNSFVTDPKLRDPLNKAAANTATITDTGTRIAANTETISKNGIVMSQKAIEIEDKAKGLEDDAKAMFDKLTGVFGRKATAPLLAGVTGTMDVLRESHPNHVRTDFNVAVPIRDQTLHVGIFDAFESNKINAELGRHFAQGSELLYGVYASKPAVGVDFRLAPRLYLRGDLFDVNNPRLDLRARLELGNGFYGWLGMEKVFGANAPAIGIGFRK